MCKVSSLFIKSNTILWCTKLFDILGFADLMSCTQCLYHNFASRTLKIVTTTRLLKIINDIYYLKCILSIQKLLSNRNVQIGISFKLQRIGIMIYYDSKVHVV